VVTFDDKHADLMHPGPGTPPEVHEELMGDPDPQEEE